jgi:hypothetical protein
MRLTGSNWCRRHGRGSARPCRSTRYRGRPTREQNPITTVNRPSILDTLTLSETLNASTIVGVDFDQLNLKYFQLKCGNKIYAMQYDAVHQYVDMDHTNYDAAKFCLPLSTLANPERKGGVMVVL